MLFCENSKWAYRTFDIHRARRRYNNKIIEIRRYALWQQEIILIRVLSNR